MNGFFIVASFILVCVWAWPAGFGRWLAQVIRAYNMKMKEPEEIDGEDE